MVDAPVIGTERLLIVPFSEGHLTSLYVGWLNDPEVMRYSDQRFHTHTPESCREYWLSFKDTPNYFWAIMNRNPETGHIGNINAYLDVNNGVADVGVLIGEKSLWGRGYASEAMLGVSRYLLNGKDVRKVTAGTMAINAGMLGVMRKMGMRADGQRIRQCIFEGVETDIIHAALFKRDME